MGELIGTVIILAICFLPGIINEHKACNRIPPDGYQTDSSAIIRDKVNGMSNQQVYTKMNQGQYDIKKK